MVIKNKKESIKELIELYSKLRLQYGDLLIKLQDENSWNELTDTRIVSLKNMIESIQSKIVLLHLINEYFSDLSLWNQQNFHNNEEKEVFLNIRLYFVYNELKENLFMKIFIRFENFIKIIAKSLNLNGNKINGLSKSLIDKLSLNEEYKDLIDLFTHTRNLVHTEGFHTYPDNTVSYKGKDYKFLKNQPVTFFSDHFLYLLLTEIKNLISEIIENENIKDQVEISHTYKNLTFDFE